LHLQREDQKFNLKEKEVKVSDTLVINADGQPVSYLPLSAVQWKEAILYMYLDKCNVLEWYDDWVVHSANWETRVPAVIMLKDYLRRTREPRFSKGNVFLRDQYHCLYCGTDVTSNTGTMDHVLPISRGGKTSWDNIATACSPCNAKKGNSMNMRPEYKPYKPGYYELVRKRKQMGFDIKHPSWYQWLDLEMPAT
jgi:5-methylcytosine-specific restriction endonuclease McrA